MPDKKLLLLVTLAALTPSLPAAELPLTRVVAFNTGVAFFEHAGTVTGDQSVTMTFDAEDVNDVLKSLVLLDLDGGTASAVTYDNREPLHRSLGGLSIDLSQNQSLAEMLKQLRGQEVEVEEQAARRGRIVGVESRVAQVGESAAARDHLLLSTERGLVATPLDLVRTLRLVDEELNTDFQRALELLAESQSSRQKQVTLQFNGTGKRRVVVGYIQEFPVWKTTYRLVLDDKKKPYLQGWAIVENTSDKDWKEIDLSLVSGQPISFLMNLYEPLYVRRPEVKPDVFAGVGPQVYGRNLGEDPFGDAVDLIASTQQTMGERKDFDGSGGGFGGGGFGGGGGAFGGSFGLSTLEEKQKQLQDSVRQSSQTMGVGGEVGEFFRYRISQPVTVASEHSAMLPIITSEIDGEKLSFYNPAVHAAHPLSGFRLKNSTDLHLMAGPVTLFDDGEFAGDARLGDVPAGEERLISYALDLGVEVVQKPIPQRRELVSATMNQLALVLKHAQTTGELYAVVNASDDAKPVLIERPKSDGWGLVEPEKPAETTRDSYRFTVEAGARETQTLRVKLRREQSEVVPMVSMSDKQLAGYLEMPELTAAARRVLLEYSRRKERLAQAEAALAETTNRLLTYTQDQARVRQNMQNLDRDSSLHRRFADKLGEHETKLEALREELLKLRENVKKLKDSLLDGLEED